MNRQAVIPGEDAYSEVVSTIQRTERSMISVPELSTLLGVKATTLNARFRRENTAVQTIGRTNFITRKVALRLAEMHKYALIGWLTLKHVSELTGIKSGTIKAWCETDQVEGHIDLTKRLRIAPAALQTFRPINAHRKKAGEPHQRMEMPVGVCRVLKARNARTKGNKTRIPRSAALRVPNPFGTLESADVDLERVSECVESVQGARRLPVLSPPPEPHIRIMTRKDYGLPEIEESPELKPHTSTAPANERKRTGPLSYDPDRPFSVTECAVGRRMRYGQYDGTILRVLDDPFSPRIQVAFPEHQHPLMREVLLVVGRRSC